MFKGGVAFRTLSACVGGFLVLQDVLDPRSHLPPTMTTTGAPTNCQTAS